MFQCQVCKKEFKIRAALDAHVTATGHTAKGRKSVVVTRQVDYLGRVLKE